MDTVTNAFTSLFSSLNFLAYGEAKTPDKTADKVYGFVALMEFGLHPMRNPYTKYKIEYFEDNKHIFKFIPMEPNTLIKSATQGISRYWFGASQKDLFIMDEELIIVIQRYVWDKNYQADIFVFLHGIVKPGLLALRKTYEKKDSEAVKKTDDKKEDKKGSDVIIHIDNWIKTIDCACPCCQDTEPCLQVDCKPENPCKKKFETTLESFCEQINKHIIPGAKSDAEKESNTFFENCLQLMKVEDNPFGKRIKNLLSVERLQAINKIYTQSVIGRMSASQEEIKLANETFNQFIIGPAEEQITHLHKDFIALHAEATRPYLKPLPEAKPQLTSTAPVEISRPGGVKRPQTPKLTPTNSISISPPKNKDKDNPLNPSQGALNAPKAVKENTDSTNALASEKEKAGTSSTENGKVDINIHN